MHAALCDYIADVVHNAVEAGATRVELAIETDARWVSVRVEDNGKGMDVERLRQARDPFFSEAGKHARRRVGLGIPLLVQAAEAAGGAVEIRSAPGAGTTVAFRFAADHVDTPPLGDLPGTLMGLMALPGANELTVRRRTPAGDYAVARTTLQETLGDLTEASNLALVRQYLASLEEDVVEEPSKPAGPRVRAAKERR